jgi:GT2 family glycosyltransferase
VEGNPGPRLSVIIVTWNERELVERCLPPLVEQLRPGDELIVADNASEDGTLDAVRRLAPDARTIAMSRNAGYMPACNRAAGEASGDLLLLLDADAIVAPGFCDVIRRPLQNGRSWDAWMGLLTMDNGRQINTSGGVVHFTGISWAGEVGRPTEEVELTPREVGFATGCCMAITAETWARHPGFPEDFFLYCDDVDYSLRVRLAGGLIGIEPAAKVDHLYDFTKRRVKWRLLERNRWATVVRTYPRELLILVFPGLLLTEIAVLALAARGGWASEKLLATADVVRAFPRLLRERRRIQSQRAIAASDFAAYMTADLSSPYLGRAGRSLVLRAALRAYWSAVRATLRLLDA